MMQYFYYSISMSKKIHLNYHIHFWQPLKRLEDTAILKFVRKMIVDQIAVKNDSLNNQLTSI